MISANLFSPLENAVDRVYRGGNWPGRNREQDAEDERFNREFQMIFRGEEMVGELANRSTISCLVISAEDSGDFDYAHESP